MNYSDAAHYPISLASCPPEYLELTDKQEQYLEDLLKRHQLARNSAKSARKNEVNQYSLAATSRVIMANDSSPFDAKFFESFKREGSDTEASERPSNNFQKKPVYLPPFLRNRGDGVGKSPPSIGYDGDTSANSVKTNPDRWRVQAMTNSPETPWSGLATRRYPTTVGSSISETAACTTPHIAVKPPTPVDSDKKGDKTSTWMTVLSKFSVDREDIREKRFSGGFTDRYGDRDKRFEDWTPANKWKNTQRSPAYPNFNKGNQKFGGPGYYNYFGSTESVKSGEWRHRDSPTGPTSTPLLADHSTKTDDALKCLLEDGMKALLRKYHELEMRRARDRAKAIWSQKSAASQNGSQVGGSQKGADMLRPGRPPKPMERALCSPNSARNATSSNGSQSGWMAPDWLGFGKLMLGLGIDGSVTSSDLGSHLFDVDEDFDLGPNVHLSMSNLGVCLKPFFEEYKSIKNREYALDDVCYFETDDYQDFAIDGYFSCPEGNSDTGRHHQRSTRSCAFHSVGHATCSQRHYVHQFVDRKLDVLIARVLRSVHVLQERDRVCKDTVPKPHSWRSGKSDGSEQLSSRRFVVGMREVEKACTVNRGSRCLMCIILAPNIDECTKPGGLDEKILTIMIMAEKAGIPVVFGLNRTSMGRAFGKRSAARSTMSVLGILDNCRGNEKLVSDMLTLSGEYSEAWKAAHPYATSYQTLLNELLERQEAMNVHKGFRPNKEHTGYVQQYKGYMPSLPKGRRRGQFQSKFFDPDR
eukprot:Platyproteum_vivax@DN5295_c0_g1_i1.p1